MRALLRLAATLPLTLPAVARTQPLERAAALAREGRTRAALEALGDEPSAAGRYLAARLYDRLQSWEAAADAYAAVLVAPDVGTVPEEVRARLPALGAMAAARAWRCDPAAAMLERLEADRGPFQQEARALLALCAVRTRSAHEAMASLERALAHGTGDVDAMDLELALATLQAQAGRTRSALERLRGLRASRPDHPRAQDVERLIAQLGGPAEPTVDERLDRAERWLAIRLAPRALEELERVAFAMGAASPTRRARFHHLRGRARIAARRDAQAAASDFATAARLGGPTAVEDAFWHARALERAGLDARAIAAYRRFARTHPGSARASDAIRRAALLEMQAGRPTALERWLREAPSGEDADVHEAAMRLGLHALDRGQAGRAIERFERARHAAPDGMSRARALYWSARAHLQGGARDAAIRALRAALEPDPLGWYALLARDWLSRLGAPFADAFAAPPVRDPEPPVPSLPLPAAVSWHARLGLLEEARADLERHAPLIRARLPPERADAELAAARLAIGDVHGAYRLAVRGHGARLARPPDAADGWVWAVAYPRPHEEHVRAAASAEGIDPELIWAVMRQESAYDPRAVSRAGARGLLQLMPATAQAIARVEGASVDDPDVLFEPARNIAWGARYLARQRARFGFPLALVAYNAGGHRLERWLGSWPGLPLDAFVERIPIDEPRNYVRRVTGHLARYLYLSGRPDEAFALLRAPR
ncbi:MAG: lytic transglycosylase domain-containing protein [Myxococcota bacterium]|nr:lytic transglycosylase domain-containing protein [Myxococcota bacterium]MDW8362618.1 lytic transglycosylase domain-containing protein [Myxococcales bacterium]